MSLFDLGKRLFNVARQQGQALWQEIEPEFQHLNPQWDKVKDNVRSQSNEFFKQVRSETRRWLEEELRFQQTQWRTLLGRDPEIERAYQLLSLPYGTQLPAVKQRWRDLLKESHPDLHMQDPTQHTIATQKSQLLTAAYHQITKAFDDGRLQ